MPDDSPTQDDLLFALERELGHQSLHIHHIVVVGPLRLLNALVESLYFQTFIQRYFTFFFLLHVKVEQIGLAAPVELPQHLLGNV